MSGPNDRRIQRSGSSSSLSSDEVRVGKGAHAHSHPGAYSGGFYPQYGMGQGFPGQVAQYGQTAQYGYGGQYGQGAHYGHSGVFLEGAGVGGARRHGRYQRQVIRLPEHNAPNVRQIRRRLPTPEPDTLERIYIQRAAPEIVEEITEVPTTPPPRIQERTIVEPAGPPQVIRKTIRVPPRSGGYVSYQPQFQPPSYNTGGVYHNASALFGSESYGNIAPVEISGGYGAPAPAYNVGFDGAGSSGYSSGFQGHQGVAYGPQGVQPGYSAQPAFCFQI